MRLLRFAVAALVVTATLAVPGRAEASVRTCVGIAVMDTLSPMYFIDFGPAVVTPFTMVFPNSGTCAPDLAFALANGVVTGHCGFATGVGVADGHHQFDFVWFGPTMTFHGPGVYGELVVYPDFTATFPQSCIAGANRFLAAGSLTLV